MKDAGVTAGLCCCYAEEAAMIIGMAMNNIWGICTAAEKEDVDPMHLLYGCTVDLKNAHTALEGSMVILQCAIDGLRGVAA